MAGRCWGLETLTDTHPLLTPAENPRDELTYEDLVKLRVVSKRTLTFVMLSGTADAEGKIKVFMN